MHTQASAEQSTPQGHPSLGARHLSRDQGGFRATEPWKTLKADRKRRHLSGGRQMFSGTFLQMPPPPGSLPCPHHPRAPSFPARGDREERRRSGIRKRVQTEGGLLNLLAPDSPRQLLHVSYALGRPVPLSHFQGWARLLSTLPCPGPCIPVGQHQGASTGQGPCGVLTAWQGAGLSEGALSLGEAQGQASDGGPQK